LGREPKYRHQWEWSDLYPNRGGDLVCGSLPEIFDNDFNYQFLVARNFAYFSLKNEDVSSQLALGGFLRASYEALSGEPKEQCSNCQNQSEKGERAGSGNLNNLHKWKFCLNAA
jgi:hypothetical protein